MPSFPTNTGDQYSFSLDSINGRVSLPGNDTDREGDLTTVSSVDGLEDVSLGLDRANEDDDCDAIAISPLSDTAKLFMFGTCCSTSSNVSTSARPRCTFEGPCSCRSITEARSKNSTGLKLRRRLRDNHCSTFSFLNIPCNSKTQIRVI